MSGASGCGPLANVHVCMLFIDRVAKIFLEELFSAKIMIPAMEHVSTPVRDNDLLIIIVTVCSLSFHLTLKDFLNKVLILVFDKDSVSFLE